MNNRVAGTVYRGEAIYYTFQRLSTGVAYLDKLEGRGKDLKEFTVVFTKDGNEQTKTAPAFRSWAKGLKTLDPVPAKAAPKSSKKADKKPVKKAAKPRAASKKQVSAEQPEEQPAL